MYLGEPAGVPCGLLGGREPAIGDERGGHGVRPGVEVPFPKLTFWGPDHTVLMAGLGDPMLDRRIAWRILNASSMMRLSAYLR